MRRVYFFCLFVLAISCAKNEKELITLGFEKDLFPEGITTDPVTQTIYLNSLRHGKIVKCNVDGSGPSDFITIGQYNYLPGFGMTIKGDTLFALGNSLPKRNSKSILLLLNKNTGAFINSYAPTDTTFKYLNDLVVCRNGDIYITDSESNKIYTIQHDRDSLEVFLDSEEVKNSNGITISDDGKYLYIASMRRGIRIVDLSTKKILNERNPDYTVIDGMKYYKNSLIAIRELKDDKGVFRFFLNEDGTAIIRKEKIIPYDNNFQAPTTFSIMDDYIYFIVNTQIDNFNDQKNEIIDSDKLKTLQMMKFKID